MKMSIERLSLDYKNFSEKYIKKNNDYSKQYNRIYLARLERMSVILKDVIETKWKGEYPICSLHKLPDAKDNEKYIVIGTLFKDQKLKPSVLKRLSEANQLIPQPIQTQFTDESDILYIEDEMQRYRLINLFNGKDLVTGITCALLVVDMGKGKLMVHDYCFAGCRNQIERPIFEENLYIIFLSGLDLINPAKTMLALQIFREWIFGALGDWSDFQPTNMIRLILAGNYIRNEKEINTASLSLTSKNPICIDNIEAAKTLDSYLSSLCKVIDVDVMSGENDPTNHILPQQPMHRCIFTHSGAYKSLHLASNPYECNVGGLQIMGTSGQPVTDIMNYCDVKDPLDVLENCLKWNHLAPTAPDTLGCYPFNNEDPFIIESCPHVFFAANQDRFSTRIYEGNDGQIVRLISIPVFSSTFTACVLNVKNLDCVPISFNF